jgi:molybdate transport system substrate-binding protein
MSSPTEAPTAPVSLWCSLVVRGPLESSVLSAFTARDGAAVDVDFDPTTVLLERLAGGDRPAVIVSTTASLNALDAGILAPGSISPLVRTGIGVGVAAGAAQPPIGTVAELAAALHSARSVAYSQAGQSGIYFASLITQLGIADEVNARATILPKGFTGFAVTDGRADLAIQQVSELRFVPGIDVVGSLPDEVQLYTDFSVAIAAPAAESASARSLHAFLTGDVANAAYTADGLLPLSA